MRYLSYTVAGGSPTWGVSVDGTVYDLGPSGLNLAPTLKDAIASGVYGTVQEPTLSGAPTSAEAEITFLPAIVEPNKIICIGVNYRTHREETGRTEQSAPTIFFRLSDTQLGHLEPAIYPSVSEQFDYEGELAVVIADETWRVDEADALNHVAGYGAYNDFTARDWQRITSQWGPGKNFPLTGSFGPYLVPASDVGDVTQLHLQTRVNGGVRQDADLADLIFDIPQLISYTSQFTRLHAGDVIVTGTPGGVGLFSNPVALLEPGHVVEVEITGPNGFTLGTLKNTVAAES